MATMEDICPAPVCWSGWDDNVWKNTDIDGVLSFYGMVLRDKCNHVIYIKGALILRALNTSATVFPLAVLTGKVGVTSNSSLKTDYGVGECQYRTHSGGNSTGGDNYYKIRTDLNAWHGYVYVGNNDANVYLMGMINSSNGEYHAWSWNEIGIGNPVSVDMVVTYDYRLDE